MWLSTLANNQLGTIPSTNRLKNVWLEMVIFWILVVWAGSRSEQNVRIHVSPNASLLLRKGLSKIRLEEFYVPNLFKNSWMQLGLLVIGWRFEKELEPTRREAIQLKHSGGDQVLLDWFIPEGTTTTASTPIIVYIPGVTGRLKEATAIIQRVNAKGWIAVVFHRRGHEVELKRPTFNIFGSAVDLKIAIDSIRLGNPQAPIALIGSSAGSAVMVRYLGQYGDQVPVVAGVGHSPGYDIENLWKPIAGSFFDRYLVRNLQKFFLNRNRPLLMMRNPEAVKALDSAETTGDFSRHAAVFSAEYSELQDITHTYDQWLEQTCPLRVAPGIRVPTLCINALDDPISHREMVEGVGITLPTKIEHCALIVTENGSHCAHQALIQ